ncbi:MAG: AAA family ATPase [Oscillospiraceae bacterium]|nr:AAA family ATPase [Oscillospiraceae bacterium]
MNELLIQSLEIDWDQISADSYLRRIPSVSAISEWTFRKPITYFSGENGSGKSTLLEAIAVAYGFNPEGGTRNYCFSTRDSHSVLGEAMRLVKGYRNENRGYFLRAESFYNVATAEEEYTRIGGIPAHFHERSHGESFLHLAQSAFSGGGVYLLDEPEAALSPQRQLTLMIEISRCIKEGAQFIIATHSPILLGFPDAEILSFDGSAIRTIPYEETESFQITRLFVNRREQLLRQMEILS